MSLQDLFLRESEIPTAFLEQNMNAMMFCCIQNTFLNKSYLVAMILKGRVIQPGVPMESIVVTQIHNPVDFKTRKHVVLKTNDIQRICMSMNEIQYLHHLGFQFHDVTHYIVSDLNVKGHWILSAWAVDNSYVLECGVPESTTEFSMLKASSIYVLHRAVEYIENNF